MLTDADQAGYVPEERQLAAEGLLSFDAHPVQQAVEDRVRRLGRLAPTC